VTHAKNYYRPRSIRATLQFIQRLDALLDLIARSPQIFPPYDRDCRFAKVPRYPYMVVFRERATDWIEVLAVANTHRRPGYWRWRKYRD
jgi:plasmid stabilization system protein ParE